MTSRSKHAFANGCAVNHERTGPERALSHAAAALAGLGQPFALVGGLAVSVRAEIRFTRDVDLAAWVSDDTAAEGLIYQLRDAGYEVIATVEHETRDRLATARLSGSAGVVVDLLLASSGIEREIAERATPLILPGVGEFRLPAPRS